MILDTTLRDGSYAIDFQFTVEDTILLCTSLDQAGIPLIEIGHGLGFNGGSTGGKKPAATDEEYLAAAATAVSKSQFGMFCIPGIARPADLELGRKYGMHFVRVGVDVPNLSQAEPFIKRAKDFGYDRVFINFMKSYSVSPEVFGEHVAKVADWGVDGVFLVDSAGGMLPQDIRAYLRAARDFSSVQLGFHGHDNLCLALSNALEAIDCGALIIDSSLQGLGRSAGNVMTEVLVAVLKRLGHEINIDERLLQNVGDRVIRPLLRSFGRDPITLTSGYAMFHSSFLGVIREYANKYKVDARDIIIELCRTNKVNSPKELVEYIAEQLSAKGKTQNKIKLPEINRLLITEVESLGSSAKQLARSIHVRASKMAIRSIFNIEVPVSPSSPTRLSQFIQEGFGFVVGSAKVGDEIALREILTAIDGWVDAVFLDVEIKGANGAAFALIADQVLTKSSLYIYQDTVVWAHAIRDQLLALFDSLTEKKLALFGDTPLAFRLAHMAADMGAEISLCGWPEERVKNLKNILTPASGSVRASDPHDAVRGANAIIGTTQGSGEIKEGLVAEIDKGCIILDGGIGTLSPEVVKACVEKGTRVIRSDMRAALAAEIMARLGTYRIVKQDSGRADFDGVSVVAGGEVGRKGEIIVDSLNEPEIIVGVADGCGNAFFEIPREQMDAAEKVWKYILKKKMNYKT